MQRFEPLFFVDNTAIASTVLIEDELALAPHVDVVEFSYLLGGGSSLLDSDPDDFLVAAQKATIRCQ